MRSAPLLLVLAAISATLLAGCVATISQPRGEAHLAAMRDASRHFHHGRFEEAGAAWADAARAAERRVDREEAEYARARALLRLDRPREALPILDALARHRPIARRTVRARFDAARIRLALGETEAARRALLWIVTERPGDGAASRALRLLMQEREASPIAERARFLEELYPRVGASDLGDDVLSMLAELQLEAGARDRAMVTLERIVEEHPYPRGQRWDDALSRLAELAEEAGDYAAAIAWLERMTAFHELTISPGSQTLPRFPRAPLRIARIYRDRLDDPARAAAHFRDAHDRFPTSTVRDDALYELGAMWLDRGRRDEGCGALRQVVREFEVGRARRQAARRLEADCRQAD